MHIDFAPPSNGTYNNSGSCRQLANYLEHEDLERMEKGIYTEGFFNLTDDNIYKSIVIKDIDTHIGQLLKTDAKFYAIHVSPSEKELRAMGNTVQEQAEAMKRYLREVFIPEYAKNFNKELSASDIKFYGKIHFNRSRSDNDLNMHCHLIVSRKDQTGKKKLSPLTNHKNTKNGVIKGGFDRVNLFQQVELGFDWLFSYNRQQTESFKYHNTMKNNSISEQFYMQKLQIYEKKIKVDVQQSNPHADKQRSELSENKKDNRILNIESTNYRDKDRSEQSFNLPDIGSISILSLFALDSNHGNEEQQSIIKRKKKHKRRFKQ